MARYNVASSFTLTAAGTDADLLSIQPASNKPCQLVSLIIGQSSEVAEAQEEDLRISILRLPSTFTVGSGGSAVTPAKTKRANQAAGFTARVNDTTVSTTSGTSETLVEMGWNERATPVELRWDNPEDRFDVVNGEGLVVRCQTTAADDLTMQITAVIEELP